MHGSYKDLRPSCAIKTFVRDTTLCSMCNHIYMYVNTIG